MEAWGRKKRSFKYEADDEMTLSHEILVLDFNDPDAATSSRSTSDSLSTNGNFIVTNL